jgi:hypothetical protein
MQVVMREPGMTAALIPEGLLSISVRMTGTKSHAVKLGNEPDRVLTRKRSLRSFGDPDEQAHPVVNRPPNGSISCAIT